MHRKNRKAGIFINGSLAEWLGAGLQNRLQQFDSARNLHIFRIQTHTLWVCFVYGRLCSALVPLFFVSAQLFCNLV